MRGSEPGCADVNFDGDPIVMVGSWLIAEVDSRWWEPATEVRIAQDPKVVLVTTHLQPRQPDRQPFRIGSSLRSD